MAANLRVVQQTMLIPAEVVLKTRGMDWSDNNAPWGKPGEPGLPRANIKLQT